MYTTTFRFTIFILLMISFADNPCLLRRNVNDETISSKVWCTERWGMKTCNFHNLYFHHKFGFMFMLNNGSTISGLDSYNDLIGLKLSPVDGNSVVNMQLTMIRKMDSFREPIRMITGNYFMVYRFKPDNFMHVIHDDLIPLFTTFNDICLGNVTECSTKFHLVFADPHVDTPFIHWYRALSSKKPLSIPKFSSKLITCFSSVTLGVANTSFFQYGFKKPQGPVRTRLKRNDVLEFRNYLLNFMNIRTPLSPENYLVVTLISRSINRKIINEDYVFQTISMALHNGFKTRQQVLLKIDMIDNSTNEILNAVASSDILIAVHGAETVLSLFLKDQSIFIELFPFGIVRENVSPISSLFNSSTTHFHYMSWTNLEERNSIAHPEYPSQFGGVDGLPMEEIKSIYDTKTISAVECCNNPYYLFRMYQDTKVDESFQKVAHSAVNIMKTESTKIFDITSQWFFPGRVNDLRCKLYPNLIFIKWSVPFNVIDMTAVYNVTVLKGSNHYNIVTEKTELYFKLSSVNIEKIQVWVSCHVNQRTSVDSYCQCEINS